MIYFATPNFVKIVTSVTANVEEESVAPFIATSADLWVQPILGMEFYEYLLEKYNDATLNADEEILVKKIKKGLAWRTAAECAQDLTFQLKNKGLQTQNSDNSESVDLQEMQVIKNAYTSKAVLYENMLIKWLNKNKDLFPEFMSESNMCSCLISNPNNNNSLYFKFI